MTAVEDLLAHYEDSGPSLRRPQQVAHDLRKALAADAREASQNLEATFLAAFAARVAKRETRTG